MHLTSAIQDAIDFWNADDTQWLLTDGLLYAIGTEAQALTLLRNTRWELTSPERLERQLAQA